MRRERRGRLRSRIQRGNGNILILERDDAGRRNNPVNDRDRLCFGFRRDGRQTRLQYHRTNQTLDGTVKWSAIRLGEAGVVGYPAQMTTPPDPLLLATATAELIS
jgi:hypothetical protein